MKKVNSKLGKRKRGEEYTSIFFEPDKKKQRFASVRKLSASLVEDEIRDYERDLDLLSIGKENEKIELYISYGSFNDDENECEELEDDEIEAPNDESYENLKKHINELKDNAEKQLKILEKAETPDQLFDFFVGPDGDSAYLEDKHYDNNTSMLLEMIDDLKNIYSDPKINDQQNARKIKILEEKEKWIMDNLTDEVQAIDLKN